MKYWVVVVDEKPLNLTHIRSILSEEDIRTSCLRSGKELLKFVEKNEPDLILLDVMMPEIDGFETFKEEYYHTIDSKYGSFDLFLRDGLKLTAEEKLKLGKCWIAYISDTPLLFEIKNV